MEIAGLKSANTILNRYYTIKNLQGLSNEVLCIRVAQGTTKLPEVTVRGLKKSGILNHTVQIMVLNRKSNVAQFCLRFSYCFYVYNSLLKGF